MLILFYMKKKEWFKIKQYPHIGLPLTWDDKKRVCSYVKNKKNISKHSFLPFIRKEIISKKLRKEYDDKGNLLNNGKRKLLPPKVRPILYSNHLDSNIFAYYAYTLGKMYDKKLKEKELDEVVTAYRGIPLDPTNENSRNKCNIDFANDVFNFIRHNINNDIVAITFDIKDFFNTLNHRKLKDSWAYLIGEEKLPDDHYNVYRNITKYSYVEEKDLFKLFQRKIITETKSGKRRKKEVKKLRYMRQQGAVAFCEKEDIHLIRKKGLIRANKYTDDKKLRNYGICQGSPISSTLANIYMLEFDEYFQNEVMKVKGLYRRYSDDMVIVCPLDSKNYFVSEMEHQIKEISKLEIQKSKTQIFHFKIQDSKAICLQEFEGVLNENSHKRNFEYLGFSFDGEVASLKTSTIAKYYRKMKLSVKRSKYYSNVINNSSKGQIFKRRLYKQFSYIGSLRSKKYERKNGTTNEWEVTKKYNWGNFITYAKLAAKALDKNNVSGQIKKHWKNLNKEIKKPAGNKG